MTSELEKQKYVVGSAFCRVEFNSKEEHDDYLFRHYPHLFVKQLEPLPQGLQCSLGIHSWKEAIDDDRNGTVTRQRYCVKCHKFEWGGDWKCATY